MFDVETRRVLARPQRPSTVNAALGVALALVATGAYVVVRSKQLPDRGVINIAGMIVGYAGTVVLAVGGGSAFALWNRAPRARQGIVAASILLVGLTVLASPLAAVSAAGLAISGLVLLLSALLGALTAAPTTAAWLHVSDEERESIEVKRAAERRRQIRLIARTRPALRLLGTFILMTMAIGYYLAPSIPNGPVAGELHVRVDGTQLDTVLGEPVSHAETARRLKVLPAREVRRWHVEGDVAAVQQLIRDQLGSMRIILEVGLREVGANLVEVELTASAT